MIKLLKILTKVSIFYKESKFLKVPLWKLECNIKFEYFPQFLKIHKFFRKCEKFAYFPLDAKNLQIEKFAYFSTCRFLVFSMWDRSKKPSINEKLLEERPLNASQERSKRSIQWMNPSRDYPVNLNSGYSMCLIPGYTGTHCEFRKFFGRFKRFFLAICTSYNRHNHETNRNMVGFLRMFNDF